MELMVVTQQLCAGEFRVWRDCKSMLLLLPGPVANLILNFVYVTTFSVFIKMIHDLIKNKKQAMAREESTKKKAAHWSKS